MITVKRRELWVDSIAPRTKYIGGRRIRVIFSSGKPMNASSSQHLPPKGIPMAVLKAGELELEREEDAKAKAKAKAIANENLENPESNGSLGLRITSSPTQMNGNGGIDPIDSESNGDEIRPAPTQERTGRDIRFGNLPHPRKHERQNSEGIRPTV
jgi:hypothetical protein